MYGIRLGHHESALFYESTTGPTEVFTLAEATVILNGLLSKKARNNGIGKYLLHVLRMRSTCSYTYPAGRSLSFTVRHVGEGRFAVSLLGSFVQELVERLNHPARQSLALSATRACREERRRLRALGLYHEAPLLKAPRALAGANGTLRHHFQNSEITCADAIAVIAYAARLDKVVVRERLMRSLDEQSVATLRLKGGFVFRIDFSTRFRGLLDLSAPVTLRTTNDNTHAAHRRLRKALRTRLDRERKARQEAAEQFRSIRRFKQKMMRYAA